MDATAGAGAGAGAHGAGGKGQGPLEGGVRGEGSGSDASSDRSDDTRETEQELGEEAMHREAFETMQRELGNSLQTQELGEEHLGLKLHAELAFIEKYLALAQSSSDHAK